MRSVLDDAARLLQTSCVMDCTGDASGSFFYPLECFPVCSSAVSVLDADGEGALNSRVHTKYFAVLSAGT